MTALFSKAANSFAFGPFLLLPEQQLLLENQAVVRIGGRAFDLLTVLVERRGQVVSKSELIARVWPGLVVEEGNLKVTIAAIRRILHEAPGQKPAYIATEVGQGYRFIATVQQRAGYPAGRPLAAEPSSSAPGSGSRIYGRDDLIASIVQDLEHARLVSIVGPGGVGKTTVALAVLEAAAATHRDGAWFIDLSKAQERAGVQAAIAAGLGALAGTQGEAALLDGLRHRQALLILDNCEHVIGEVALTVDQLLSSCNHVTLVLTSREPINIRGERVRRLRGLDMPSSIETLTWKDALTYPAVQLFVDRAAHPLEPFVLDDTNASLIAAICQRLDGLALAIERVAERVGAHGLAGILEHIDRRFHMFDGYQHGPLRHRTLTANIDASYSCLSASEQAVMRLLSICPQAFGLDSASFICRAHGLDEATVREIVAALVCKSLLLAEPHEGDMRYRLPHVTRAFATEKLIESGELDQARRRLAELSIETSMRRPGTEADYRNSTRGRHPYSRAGSPGDDDA